MGIWDKIPGIAFDDLPESIATRVQDKYERLGYLGEFFARTAHQEKGLAAFIDFTQAGSGSLDTQLVELIALTVTSRMGVVYERNQHERLSVKLGFGRCWVKAVEALNPEDASLSELSQQQRLVQRFVLDALKSDGHQSTDALEQLVIALGVENAVAVMMVMVRYVGHGLMVNSLKLSAPVPSIFDDGFGL